jgi:hypothetical protein
MVIPFALGFQFAIVRFVTVILVPGPFLLVQFSLEGQHLPLVKLRPCEFRRHFFQTSFTRRIGLFLIVQRPKRAEDSIDIVQGLDRVIDSWFALCGETFVSAPLTVLASSADSNHASFFVLA